MSSARVVQRFALFLMAFGGTIQAQAQPKFTFEIAGPEVVIEWLTDSTFRFCRAWEGLRCDPEDVHGAARAELRRTESESKIVFTSKYLEVEISKPDLRLRVLTRDGELLLAETSAVARKGGDVEAVRVAAPGERFYGLGARESSAADARGMIIETGRPFLLSSRGYGLHHTSPGNYVFDFTRTGPDEAIVLYRGVPRFEYWFYYGPSIKAIYEEHLEVAPPRGYAMFDLLRKEALPGRASLLPAGDVASWKSLEGAIRGLVHASLSGILNPAFDLGAYAEAPLDLYRRAAQFASIVPLICDSGSPPLDPRKHAERQKWLVWRQRLIPFLLAYVEETNQRGFPMIHPLAMQFPKDEPGGLLTDQFLLGDEILAAPVYTVDGRRRVYLPMGRWTDLYTNKEHAGRQTIEIQAEPDVLPLFARNGSIVPLAGETAAGPMELHYFPSLAGELFLYEPEIRAYTQVHAAPALDIMRLEIEAKAARSYEWVAHHLPKPNSVTAREKRYVEVTSRQLLKPGNWYYDESRRNVHVAVEVERGQTLITHLSF